MLNTIGITHERITDSADPEIHEVAVLIDQLQIKPEWIPRRCAISRIIWVNRGGRAAPLLPFRREALRMTYVSYPLMRADIAMTAAYR
jgi:hypothetical protein